MKRNVYAIFLTLLLTGCVAAPGMKMVDPLPNVSGVTITRITPELIYAQRANENLEAAQPAAAEGLWNDKRYQYLIGRQDILSIIVWDHPELAIPAAAGGPSGAAATTGHLVVDNGTIFFPYIGTLQVAGKTVDEVRRILTQRISRFIVNPQLDVRVAVYRSQKAYVVGEVKQPGPLPITDVPLTVIEAVNSAGGLTPDADLINVTLTHDGNVYDIDLLAMYQEGDTTQNRSLKDGDLLRIPDRREQKVFVMGEVGTPSSLPMNNRRMTLTEALGDAGGVDRVTSKPANIYVIRGNGNESEIYHLNAKSPNSLILGDQFQLKPRDVVYVEAAGVTRWNRVIQQILPTATVIDSVD